VRFAELIGVSWRNGGSLTRRVVASGGSGQQGFDWRISIADVDAPGLSRPSRYRSHDHRRRGSCGVASANTVMFAAKVGIS
jgi:HutD